MNRKLRLFNRLNKPVILAVVFIAAMMFTGKSHAANPQNLDIHVSVSNSKDLTVDSTFYNYGALAVNTASVTATAITVTNPIATGLIETFTIKGGTATADGGGTDWILASSTGTDQYALAAQFSDTMPNNVTADWASDDLNTHTAVTATASVLGNNTPEESGASVMPGTTRKLWFRIRTPNVVTDPGHHKITITLSVL